MLMDFARASGRGLEAQLIMEGDHANDVVSMLGSDGSGDHGR
jgi:hypothetical protein